MLWPFGLVPGRLPPVVRTSSSEVFQEGGGEFNDVFAVHLHRALEVGPGFGFPS